MRRIALILTLAALPLFAARADDDDAASAVKPVATVETAVAAVRDVAETLDVYGSVTAGPQYARNVDAPRAGEVSAIAVLPGQAVKRGAPLVTLSAAPESAAAYLEAKAEAEFAQTSLARTEVLFKQRLATNVQLADSRRAAAQAEAALAAQQKLGGGAVADVLRAPDDGVVNTIAVRVGDRVAENTPLVGFSGTVHPYAELGLSPQDATNVRPGMSVRVTSVFEPARTAASRVQEVGAAVDPASGLVELMVPLPAGGGFITGGAVTGAIVLAAEHEVAVPRSAVLRDDHGAYVFVVKAGVAHRVDVRAGIDDGRYIAVDKGLHAGDKVVTLGNYELDDGMAVREPTA